MHPAPRRSQRHLTPFFHGLLGLAVLHASAIRAQAPETYVRRDGTVTLTGPWNAGNQPITSQNSYSGWNVLAFGATGNCNSDDSPGINAAIHLANLAGGGNVVFPTPPGGCYLIRSSLVVASDNVTLTGLGSPIIRAGSGSPIDMITVGMGYSGLRIRNVRVSRLLLDGNFSANRGVYTFGARIVYLDALKIINVQGNPGVAIDINSDVEGCCDNGDFEIRITNNRLVQNTTGIRGGGDNNQVDIVGNSIENNSAGGVLISSHARTGSESINVIGNTFQANGPFGLKLNFNDSNVIVAGNYFTIATPAFAENGDPQPATSTQRAIVLTSSFQVHIDGNYFAAQPGGSLPTFAIDATAATDLTVTNNQFQNLDTSQGYAVNSDSVFSGVAMSNQVGGGLPFTNSGASWTQIEGNHGATILAAAGGVPTVVAMGIGGGGAVPGAGSLDGAGTIVLQPGSGSGSSGDITLTLSPNATSNSTPILLLTPTDGTGAWNPRVAARVTSVSGPVPWTFTLHWDNNGVPLSAGNTYKLAYLFASK